MKTLKLVQNSDEWLALRKTKLGASDANIIMGQSDYKTPRGLYLDKKGLTKEDANKNTFATDKGHRIEPKIRAMMEIEYGCDLEAIICVTDDYPNYMASLDGYGENSKGIRYVLECKYVGQEDFDLVKSGKILPQYKPQLMKQLTLTGADFNILAVATENKEDLDEKGKPRLKYAHVLISPDINYIKNELLPALAKFWKCLEDNKEPALVYDDVLEDNDNVELGDALTRYEALEKEADEVTARLDKVKAEVFKLARHDKVICNGVKVYTVRTKGKTATNYDYEGFLKDSKLELPETYITTKVGKASVSQQIKWPKEETIKPEEMIVPGAHIKVLVPGHGEVEVPAGSTVTIPGPTKEKRKRRTKAEMESAKQLVQ